MPHKRFCVSPILAYRPQMEVPGRCSCVLWGENVTNWYISVNWDFEKLILNWRKMEHDSRRSTRPWGEAQWNAAEAFRSLDHLAGLLWTGCRTVHSLLAPEEAQKLRPCLSAMQREKLDSDTPGWRKASGVASPSQLKTSAVPEWEDILESSRKRALRPSLPACGAAGIPQLGGRYHPKLKTSSTYGREHTASLFPNTVPSVGQWKKATIIIYKTSDICARQFNQRT